MSATPQNSAADRPFAALAAGEGHPLSPGAQLVGRAEWSEGAFISVRADVQPHFFSPVHKHERQNQTSVVISGTLGFWVEGEDDVVLGPGGYVFRPQGRYHAFWNPTGEAGSVLEITSPGTEFERWMLDLSEMQSSGASKEAVAERGAQAGIVFSAELTAELARRLGIDASDVFGK